MFSLKIATITITIRRIRRDKRPSVWTPTSWRSGWCCRKKVIMSCHVSASEKASSLSPATDPPCKPRDLPLLPLAPSLARLSLLHLLKWNRGFSPCFFFFAFKERQANLSATNPSYNGNDVVSWNFSFLLKLNEARVFVVRSIFVAYYLAITYTLWCAH